MGSTFSKSISFIALAIFTTLAFQNCTGIGASDGERTPHTRSSGGNGWAYDGKVYNSVAQCADGTPESKIKVADPETALLIKENCQVLPAPQLLANADWSIDPNQPEQLTYLSQPFVLEQPPVNKIAFVQNSSRGNLAAATNLTSNAFNSPVTTGNLIICSLLYNSPNATAQVNAVVDNLGNAYQRAVAPLSAARQQGLAGYTMEVWYRQNATGGAGHQATAVFSESIPSAQFIKCYEYSGLVRQNALDESRTAVISSFTPTTLTLGPVSTNFNNELVFVAYYGNLTSVGPDFVHRNGGDPDGASDRFLTSTSTFTLNIPINASTAGAVLTFKAE